MAEVEAAPEGKSVATPVNIASETMLGDLMALTLDELKHAQDCWPRLSQDEQDRAIERIETRTREAITQAVRIVATAGFVRLPATLESITVKDSIKAVLSLPKSDPNRHELFDHAGHVLTVVLADVSQFVAPHGHKGESPQLDLLIDGKLRDLGGEPDTNEA